MKKSTDPLFATERPAGAAGVMPDGAGPVLSILVISRTPENVNRLLDALAHGAVRTEFEVLCSWNGDESDPKSIDVPAGITFKLFEQRPYHFARNNNELARRAAGEYLLFINDDVRPDPGAIDHALTAACEDFAGIVGINLRYPDGYIQHAGVFFDDDGKPFHRLKHKVTWNDPAVRGDLFVPAVTGAFLLIRRKEFELLEFDEGFLVAGEDISLSLRYRERFDREILYVGGATAIHIENDTRKKTGDRLTPPEDMNRIQSCSRRTRDGRPITEVRRPCIRIVTEAPGWILHRKAEEIQKYLGNVRINEDWPDADIHYYINYGYFRHRPPHGIVVANFTHYDPDHLAEDFVRVAHEVDHCVAVSELTARKLRDVGIADEKITVILVGADARFEPKLTVGITGRIYPGGRKGEDIVRALLGDPEVTRNVRIVATREDWGAPVWSFDDTADFYRAIDYLLIPSRLEGGPVPFMEALACGTLSIAPPIGVVPQFPHVPYPVGDIAQLKAVLLQLAEQHRRQRAWLAQHLNGIDWQGWAVQHEKLFRRLLCRGKEDQRGVA